MPAARFSRRERSYAATHTTVTINSTSTYPVPYGKTHFIVSGKGQNGTAASGGNVSGDNSTYTAGNPTPPTAVPGNATPPTAVPGNATPPTAVPGNATTPTYVSNFVETYQENNTNFTSNYNTATNYSTACPSPVNGTISYTYTCTPNYTPNPPNATTYTPNPPNATNYTANPPNAANYYAGNPNYNAYYAGSNGAPATILGQTFPGGTLGPATAINAVAMAIPFSSTAVPVTVPSGGYITIQNT